MVGVAIVRTSIDVGALKSSYALEDFILFSEHQPSQARYARDMREICARCAREICARCLFLASGPQHIELVALITS